MFFGDYYPNAKNESFPTQLEKLGFNTRSFCNCMITVGYPLKNILENNLKRIRPFRDDMINDLGIVAQYNWNRKLFGNKIEDYYETADDEDREIPKKWKKYIYTNKDEKNFIFLHFWKAHYNYEINDFLENKIKGKDEKGVNSAPKELIKRVRTKQLTEKFVKKVYSRRIYEIIDKYIRDLFIILKENGMYDDSMIILTADHGEGLGDLGRYCSNRQYKFYHNILYKYIRLQNKFRKLFRFFPDTKKINNFFKWKWDFLIFYHGSDFEMLRMVPLFLKFPNNEFGGKKYYKKVTFFDIFSTVNQLTGKKIVIKSTNGTSLYSLLKDGEIRKETNLIDHTIKKLISTKKI